MFQYGPMPSGMPSQGMPGGQMPGQWYVHQDPWWERAGHLLPLVLLAVLIGVVIWAVLRLTSQRGVLATAAAPAVAPPAPVATLDPAAAELRVRYARGDISREDYLERSADLGLAPGPAPTPDTPPKE
jgi:putative membrane protein